MKMTPAILIHGPTASGKTALAIDVARRLGGEVVARLHGQAARRRAVHEARGAVRDDGGAGDVLEVAGMEEEAG